VGGAGREQPGHFDRRLGLRHVQQLRDRVGEGEAPACTPWRGATLHKLLFTGLRDAQTVRFWCEVDEADAWGKAAASAVLTQYFSGLSAVLLWLSSAPAVLPASVYMAGGPALAARLSHSRLASASQARTATRRSPCSPCSQPPWLTRSGVPQHLFSTTLMYNRLRLAGKAPHAAYLKGFCSAAGGDLLISVLQQALPEGGGASAAQAARGAAPALAGSGRTRVCAPGASLVARPQAAPTKTAARFSRPFTA
jgi:hypothetical protein